MVAVPFIYFGSWLLYRLSKNHWHFDITSYIISIFAVSGLFSILIDMFGLRSMDTYRYSISFTATLVYCVLLTVCILPFAKYSNLKIQMLRPVSNPGLLKVLSIVFFVFFIINFAASFSEIVDVVTSEDLNRVRIDHKMNEDSSWLNIPPPIRVIFVLLGLMSGASWIFIFLGFYVIIIQKLKKRYGIMYLLASVNGIIGSILDGGRSAIFYWLLSFIAVYLFFIPFMSKRQKRTVRRFFIAIGSLFVTFFMMMTIARFGERDAGEVSGTEGGLIYYAGQSFINFSFFWDTFDCPLPSLQILLPFTYKLFGYPIENAIDLQETLSFMSHRELGVFYTFIGHIATTSFNFVAILYCILLAVVSTLNVQKVRYHLVGISGAYYYLLFSSVLFLGLFGHYYAYTNKSFAIVAFAVILAFLKPEKIPK